MLAQQARVRLLRGELRVVRVDKSLLEDAGRARRVFGVIAATEPRVPLVLVERQTFGSRKPKTLGDKIFCSLVEVEPQSRFRWQDIAVPSV
ncbi:MAG: hypothetical protein NTW87_11015 [Planctomycetota bacterium]|nr:hypothetical protein [Planctomycetota bacterium]